MTAHVRRRLIHEDRGFTLIELLVVMIVASLLLAIAVPAFFSQREKAGDAEAKQGARAAAVAIETWALDHGGVYAGATAGQLAVIEPVLSGVALDVVSAAGDTYELSVTAPGGNAFVIERRSNGSSRLTCAPTGTGGCPASGTWG